MPERLFEEHYIELEDIQQAISLYTYASQFVEKKTCLDIACGEGYGSRYLALHGATWVIGGDISLQAIQHAQRTHSLPNNHFLVLDAETLPFRDNSFDIIISLETIEHLSHPGKILKECKRVLKPGAYLLLSTPDRSSHFFLTKLLSKSNYLLRMLSKFHCLHKMFVNPYHLHEFNAFELKCLLEKDFLIMLSLQLCDQKVYRKLKTLPLTLQKVLCEIFKIVHFLKLKVQNRKLKLSLLPREFKQINTGNFNILPLNKDERINYYRRLIFVCKVK
jgi:2-polyprenyl-3-methyl-5-hydroxy-6-metoxy-1,4-benzoquinol methylase